MHTPIMRGSKNVRSREGICVSFVFKKMNQSYYDARSGFSLADSEASLATTSSTLVGFT